MFSRLFPDLEAGAVLITDHSIQAQQFRLAYARWKQAQGLSAWPSPGIVAWSEWLKGLGEELQWSEYANDDEILSLLSPAQEQSVWEQVIRAETNQPLLHLPSTAALARQAWGLIHRWRLPDPAATQYPSDDVRSYTRWESGYRERCSAAGWVDQARLPDIVLGAINTGKLTLPGQVILAGFLQLAPRHKELLSCLQKRGTQVKRYQVEPQAGKTSAYHYVSVQEEFSALALWAKALIELDPHTSIAVVIPNLEQQRAELDYILRKTLYPSSLSSEQEFVNSAYQFSTGENLAASEVANLAMDLLELLQGRFSVDQISRILRNPYGSGARAEAGARLKLDTWLRTNGVLEFDLDALVALLRVYRQTITGVETEKEQSCAAVTPTLFEQSISAFHTASAFTNSRFTPSVWAKHFYTHLDVFAWPGTDLNNTEQLQVQAMQSCLSEFATLDFVQPKIDLGQALASVRRLFQGKRTGARQAFAPIQILDLKHVYGLSFEHLWIAQLSDSVLPESSQTNPLIPYAEQRTHKLSGATPELRLLEAQQRLEHLRRAAGQTVFSCASDGNTQQAAAPAMLRDMQFTMQTLAPAQPETKLASEWIAESYGPVYQNQRAVGTSLFQYQAECPFKAFAKTRLLPATPDKASYGLTPLERGRLLHKALEMLWLHLGNSESLQDFLQKEDQETPVNEIIGKVISDFETKLNHTLSTRLKRIEQTRLVRLTLAWLELESGRAPFAVHQREYKTEIEINGLRVKARIDRIDKINGVGFAIIDYKSGVQTPNAWFRERPDQPQMPIYALAEHNHLVAIVYANLKPGELGFKGLSQTSELFPDIKAFDELRSSQRHDLGWQDLIPYWREQLNALAHDYKKGRAIPDPKKGLATCRYCELETLCRVNASANAPTVLDDYERKSLSADLGGRYGDD